MSNFTPEDLLEYFYQETSPEKTEDIQYALANQWALQEKFRVITQAAERLNKSTIAPRYQSVQAILSHAAEKFHATIDV